MLGFESGRIVPLPISTPPLLLLVDSLDVVRCRKPLAIVQTYNCTHATNTSVMWGGGLGSSFMWVYVLTSEVGWQVAQSKESS